MFHFAASPWRRCVSHVLLCSVAAATLVSCHETTSPSTSSSSIAAASFADTGRMLPGGTGAQWVWVTHIAGGRYAEHVQLLQIVRTDGQRPLLRFHVLPSRDWSGQPTKDLNFESDTARLIAPGTLDAVLTLDNGAAVGLSMHVHGERATGTWSERASSGDSTSYPVVAFRVPFGVLPPNPATLQRVSSADSTPAVLLRVDDNVVSDRDFTARLIARGLPAEYAIPTFSPGINNRPSWDELDEWSRHGIAMVAHSRRHTPATASDLDFMEEVLGSLRDLYGHGLATNVFVQPGSWLDSLYFDTPQKVETWRGALLRTTSLVSECYDSPGTIESPPSDSLELCYSHVTISDGETIPQILAAWRVATKAHRFTTFLVHTVRMPTPAFLDFFLDTLQQARLSGRVNLLQTSVDAFFVRPSSPAPCTLNPTVGTRVTTDPRASSTQRGGGACDQQAP